jgi:N-acetylneuraminate synthase/N,N'-diacetyllegionaminate synthase
MKTNKTFIIAEAGVNHNGKLELAYKLIAAAAAAGADAVKFQTFRAEELVAKSAPKAEYQKQPGKNESQFEMLKGLELPLEDFAKLKAHCDQHGIEFLTSPFDFASADAVEDWVNMYKIPSGEVTNLPFLKHVARKGKPIVLSTGMCTLGEVEKAVQVILSNQPAVHGDFPPLTLLHCTTSYPCSIEEVNLKAMLTLREAFKLPVGYSDHTLGIEVAIAAAALGASVIEKHFTIDRSLPGPDHQASLEPDELQELVTAIGRVETSLGDGIKQPAPSELEIMSAVRKSLVTTQKLRAGTVLTEAMIAFKRPGTGISPEQVSNVIGMTLKKDKDADEVITWEDLKS